MNYRVEIREGQNKGHQFQVTGSSYEKAAAKAGAKLNPKVRGLKVLRITGSSGLSGVFQGFVKADGGGVTSHGPQFNVW